MEAVGNLERLTNGLEKKNRNLIFFDARITFSRQITPSFVQVHMTHGETLSAEPTSMIVLPTVHVCLSFQGSKLIVGRFWHGTIGFLQRKKKKHFKRY